MITAFRIVTFIFLTTLIILKHITIFEYLILILLSLHIKLKIKINRNEK